MVLGELGSKINQALDKFLNIPMINEELINSVLKEISIALLQADVNVKFVVKLKENIIAHFKKEIQPPGQSWRKVIQQEVAKELISMVDSKKTPFTPKKGKSNVIMFVGLQGAGKTTTCAKFANYYRNKGWKTAKVCADTFRAGAFDQLKHNSVKIRIPYYGSYTETDPVVIAEEGVKYFKKEQFEIIIVDTSGRHSQETELFEEMKQIQNAIKPDEIIFVMDGSIGQACYDQALSFQKAVNVGSVIITKLDGHAKGGGALSAVAATQSPIKFIGTGEHLSDLELFNPESFVKKLLSIKDMREVVKALNEAIDIEDQEKIFKNFGNKKFTLRSMREQYKLYLKCSGVNLANMVPGLSNSLNNKENEEQCQRRIKKSLIILDSMSDKELDCQNPINQSNIIRIAKGSGSQVEDINQLLQEYKNMSKFFNNSIFNKDKFYEKNNPNFIKNQLSQINPNIVKSMGGWDKIMDLANQLSSSNMSSLLSKQGNNLNPFNQKKDKR